MKLKTIFPILLILLIFFIPFSIYARWYSLKDFNPLRKKNEKTNKETVQQTIKKFKEIDPYIIKFFDKSAGYAVFPSIGKGGMGIGGAYGKGEVFEKGRLIGEASLTQLSIGYQLGGQVYSEIIFFKEDEDLKKFKSGNYEFGAQVSAVILKKGISTEANFDNGIAVFIFIKKGIMYQLTVGGQKFSFKAR
ncbi:hypothetical protein HY745_05965 [Candidatus Desantisbacteria bacterium]|nr:hypothetical protein [Candidatus Desantisbacteria bacterium]